MNRNAWFETVAEAQIRAQKRLPSPVYGALIAGSEKGVSLDDNVSAYSDLGFAPRLADHKSQRNLATSVMGIEIEIPVIISPTGVQAVHPHGEIAVARAAANRGTIMSLSSFASKPVEEVVAANPNTLFQVYWSGERDEMIHRIERAKIAGAKGLITTLDWSFSHGRDWGSPQIPEKLSLGAALKFAPHAFSRLPWLWSFAKTFRIPDLKAPNLTPMAGGEPPTFFGAYGEWMKTPPPSWNDVKWLREQWGGPFMLKGVGRLDDAKRAIDIGVTSVSVSNHGGNNLDTIPAPIRMLPSIADAVGDQIEVLLDGGVRRGSDVVKAVALGARAVMIGRAYLWGLAANGQGGVENVLDILRSGIDSSLLGLGRGSLGELTRDDLYVPETFEKTR